MKAVLAILAAGLANLSAQVQLLPLSVPQPPVGKAAIQGKVLDALTREPVRKASVTVNGRTSMNAVTDAAGQFSFRKLPAGQYTVQAQSDKYPNAGNVYDAARQISVTVTAEEEKKDMELLLTPGGSLSGRIVDEEGSPMPQCMVRAMQVSNTGTRGPGFTAGGTSQSDDKGEYRLENVPAGKYYVQATCPQSVPLPHAFLRRDEARNTPALLYPARFFPGAANLPGATRIPVTPGFTAATIDIQMLPATGITLRGRAHPAPSDGRLRLELRSKDTWTLQNRTWASVDPGTGEFRFDNVPPGSYTIATSNLGGDCGCYASVPVEIGETVPDPVDVPVSPTPRITGTVSFENGDKPESARQISGPPQNRLNVMLTPQDGQVGGPPAQAEVQSDGTFSVTVSPGRWQVRVNGAPGYVKSVKLGDQEVSPDNLETSAAPATLQIVMSTKFAQIEGTVSGLPADSAMVSGALWPVAAGSSFQQFFGMNPQGKVTLSVPPGRYYACAVGIAQSWMVMQNPALKKALEDHCATVEAVAGDRATFTMGVISADELKRLQDSLDSDPATPQ